MNIRRMQDSGNGEKTVGRLRKKAEQFSGVRLTGKTGKFLALIVLGVTTLIVTGCGGGYPEGLDAEPALTEDDRYFFVEESDDMEMIEAVSRGIREKAENPSEKASENITETVPETSVPVSILTAQEERRLQEEAVSAAKLCIEYYQETGVSGLQADGSLLGEFSKNQRRDVVKYLGRQGLVSVSDGVNMENYEKMEEFYALYTAGSDAMETVFEIYKEGDFCAKTFIHRDKKIQSYYVSVGRQEGGAPEIRGAGAKDLEEIRLTEKGYFIYTNKTTAVHGNLREYYRVKPLPDRCRELTDQYVYGLSYVNYNMLVTDWDAGNAEDILMPCMFEDIYRIYTGKPFRAENGRIPAEIYERIMTTCLPVTAKQLRKYCGYRADTDSYPYEMIFGKQFPPFGEVVDYTQNKDGTITLYVDGVWIDYDSDYAFTNRIVVEPFTDGTFRYLSNSIEERELEIPKIGDG